MASELTTPEEEKQVNKLAGPDVPAPEPEPETEPAASDVESASSDDNEIKEADVAPAEPPKVDTEKVDANLQESMMKPETKHVTADEIIAQHHEQNGGVAKKANSMTVVGIAVAVAVLLVGLGFAAVLTTQDEEPNADEISAPDASQKTQQSVEDSATTEPVTEAVVEDEIKALDDVLTELDAIEEVSAGGISDESLEF